MKVSYKRLFKLLIDRNLKKKDLAEMAGVSTTCITKMTRDGAVISVDILVKICVALNCTFDDIMEIIPDSKD